MDLTCPKCHGSMRTYERNGVHVDQCSECRGIFLDRGELERLTEAEARWQEGPGPRPGQPQHQASYPQAAQAAQSQSSLGGVVGEVLQQVRAQQGGHQQRYPSQYKPRKKSSFLGELFG